MIKGHCWTLALNPTLLTEIIYLSWYYWRKENHFYKCCFSLPNINLEYLGGRCLSGSFSNHVPGECHQQNFKFLKTNFLSLLICLPFLIWWLGHSMNYRNVQTLFMATNLIFWYAPISYQFDSNSKVKPNFSDFENLRLGVFGV